MKGAERSCGHCSLNEIEDGIHFVFNCPLNLALRNELLLKLNKLAKK